MPGRPQLVRCALAAALLAAGLAACTDAPITDPLPSSRDLASSTPPGDSASAPPGEVDGCVDDQQESMEDPATSEPEPCPIDPIEVVVPPSDPPPPPPPDDPPPPPPPGSGGSPPPSDSVCDPSVDWDPDCPSSPQCASGYIYDEAMQNCIDRDDVAELGCPERLPGQWSFVWNGHTFYVWGTVERLTVIRSWPWGEATYRLPPGPVTSTDGKALYSSGIGRMKCYGYLSRSGQFEGLLNLSWESGDIREL